MESEKKEKASNLEKHTTKWIISKNRDFFCVVSSFIEQIKRERQRDRGGERGRA